MNPSNYLNKNNGNPQLKKIINGIGCSEKAADAIWIWYDNSKHNGDKKPKRKAKKLIGIPNKK